MRLDPEELYKPFNYKACPTLKGLEFKVTKWTIIEGKTKAEETYLGSCTM